MHSNYHVNHLDSIPSDTLVKYNRFLKEVYGRTKFRYVPVSHRRFKQALEILPEYIETNEFGKREAHYVDCILKGYDQKIARKMVKHDMLKLLWGGCINSEHNIQSDYALFFDRFAQAIVKASGISHLFFVGAPLEDKGFEVNVLCKEEDGKKLQKWFFTDTFPDDRFVMVADERVDIYDVFLYPTGIYHPQEKHASPWEDIKKDQIECVRIRSMYPGKSIYTTEVGKMT